ncbi:MAG: cytidylate kinase-like family protein [Sphaerochaetaceae bacterium]|nr:cytidylate kinase-like family protein [Sphaerochaetaceae bacterium]
MHTVITISRQFGSGGREIGRGLAEHFNIPFYDSVIITMAAEKSGMNKEVLENLDEKASNRFLYTLPSGLPNLGQLSTPALYNIPLSDTLFLTEYEIIQDLGKKGPCVIVGRCSDYILKDMEDHVSLFIHASEQYRTKRIAEYEQISEKEAASKISKYDKERKRYHDYYAANTWGDASFYDLTINSGLLGIEKCIKVISSFVSAI